MAERLKQLSGHLSKSYSKGLLAGEVVIVTGTHGLQDLKKSRETDCYHRCCSGNNQRIGGILCLLWKRELVGAVLYNVQVKAQRWLLASTSSLLVIRCGDTLTGT